MKPKKSKQHSGKEIEFDVNLLLQSLRDHADQLEGKSPTRQIAPANSFRFKPSRKSD